MACFAVIYGRIEAASDAPGHIDAPYRGAIHAHNHRAIESLPDSDDEYPFLTRHMFGVAHPRLGFTIDRGIVRQIIHFGASLKVGFEDAQFADAWLRKFEKCALDELAWSNAVVHFEHEAMGERVVRYAACPDSLRTLRAEFAEVGARVTAALKWSCAVGEFSGRSNQET